MSIVFIVGAPRSGTNLLRDLLCDQSNIYTWPCDEINYIWRIGRPINESDNFRNGFNPSQSQYISSKFKSKIDSISIDRDTALVPVLVEKTCANCLRVDLIYTLFPDAKFIYIKRNPYDAVYSSIQRWTGGFNINYIIQKARFIPKRDVFRYGFYFFINRFVQLFSANKKLRQWGPILDDDFSPEKFNNLEKMCTAQWFMCNHLASSSFANNKRFSNDNLYSLTYEELISNPFDTLVDLFESLSIDFSKSNLRESTKVVHSKSIGKGKSSLSSDQLASIDAAISLCQAQVSR